PPRPFGRHSAAATGSPGRRQAAGPTESRAGREGKPCYGALSSEGILGGRSVKRIFVCSFLVGMGLFLSACPKPVCGDGVVDAELGEACDDGNNIDADGCEADCSLPACENGIQDPG